MLEFKHEAVRLERNHPDWQSQLGSLGPKKVIKD